jgi:hypothetical protein
VTTVVSTEAERSEAKWRDLLSARTELIVERGSLDHAALRAAPLGTTGKQRKSQ